MTTLVTPDEMQAAENAVIQAGTPASELMRRASEGIADWVVRNVAVYPGKRPEAVAFVGPGNNGGDALVTLAILHDRGWRVRAVFLGRSEVGTLPAGTDSLQAVDRVTANSIGMPNVILDGVFGFRSRASLPTTVVDAFDVARELRLMYGVPLVALDVPSGIDARSGDASAGAFPADVTLCLGLPKLGLVKQPAADFVGELVVLDIGIPSPALPGNRPSLITESIVRRLLPKRRAFAHKHDTGTVLIVGGAPTYFGAPRLAAEAALRAGAGLVCAAIPRSIVPVLAAQVPEAVLLPLDDFDGALAAEAISDYLDRQSPESTCVVIGPGLGRDERATLLLDTFFDRRASLPHPVSMTYVIDADALNWLSWRRRVPAGVGEESVVLTPHAGELARLIKCDRNDVAADPWGSAQAAARQYRQIVLLKRGFSVIATPDQRIFVAPRATPELATAGTGDVLAGLIGGLASQGLSPVDAATSGLFIGARAGERLRRHKGTYGAIARDLIETIPESIATLTDPTLRSSTVRD